MSNFSPLIALQVSLLEFLDLSQLNCLNEDSTHTLKSILDQKERNKSGSYLESDADEQLLLNIPVRVYQILWYGKEKIKITPASVQPICKGAIDSSTYIESGPGPTNDQDHSEPS